LRGPATPPEVAIHYRRPPDRLTVFRQHFVHRSDGCTITLMERTPLTQPLLIDGCTVLDDGSPAVWFTFDGLWHDIGRFHAGDTFTGWYANILTPVHYRTPLEWETTDLFLDVWLGADGTVHLLDEDELAAALNAGHVSETEAGRAHEEARRLMSAAGRGDWPPAIAREWTLARALRAVRGTPGAETV
jgi:predicted RNA-binding protein associated with RNAse of E/G family